MTLHARLRSVLCAIVALAFAFGVAVPAVAQSTGSSISGAVIDAASGLALSNARVTSNGPTVATATTDASGRFTLTGLTPGLYSLTARADAYQTTLSDTLTVLADQVANVTLSLQRVTASGQNLHTIGSTSVRASATLQKTSVSYQQLSADQTVEQGLYRFGDALRQLPGVINGGSDTAAPADDLGLDFRGIGQLETLTLLDGHPVGYGLRSPYNFDISPPALFRDVNAVYGSGASQFYPINAIGGIFDLQTINPTPQDRATLTQQVGTFATIGTLFTATGTQGKIGYAVAAASQGLNGPFHDLRLYNYSASQDPGATDALRLTGYTADNSTSNVKSLLGKVNFNLGTGTNLTLTGLTESFYDDKTGNGDNDYTPYSVALAQAKGNLGNTYTEYAHPAPGKAPSATGQTATCPAGTTALLNANGIPSGTFTTNVIGVPGLDGNGLPSLDAACVTPTQFASLESGWNGAGPAFQTYNLYDYHLHLANTTEKQEVSVDAYVDDYLHHYDRDLQQPYFGSPGDNPGSYYEGVTNSGLTGSKSFIGPQNTVGVGINYNNAAYKFVSNNGGADGAATANDYSFFLRDAYQFPKAPLTAYLNAWEKFAGESDTFSLDPRAAVVYALKNDVFRASAGSTTTQPYLSALDQPFSTIALGSLNGNVTSATCMGAANNPISIGSEGAASSLKPERGVDTEFSYGHRFFGDSQIQATFYNVNVFNKIYSATAPLSITGTSQIPPGYLSTAIGVIQGICGSNFDANTGLGISGAVNLGHVRAQGIEIAGRQRLIRPVYLDYDYGADAVVLVSAPPTLLNNQANLIPGSQLPNVPLHSYNVGLNYEFVRNADFRIAYHHVSTNNTKNLPAYGYADALLTGPVGPGRLSVAVNNLFSSNAYYTGLETLGVPLAANSFAGGSPSSTERFGLPFRQIIFTYSLSTR